jgi:hypothetical protein
MEALPQPPELHPSQRREKDHAMHDIPADGQSHKLVPQRFSRRRVLALAGAAGVGWMARGALGQAAPETKPSLHAYTNYGWLRGFSIVPSWGARIEEAW